MAIFDGIKKTGGLLKKALDMGVNNYIERLEKAASRDGYFLDPKSISGLDHNQESETGYKDRTTTVSFEILQQMGMKNTIVASVIQCRKNQIKPFGIVQPSRFDVGFKFRMRDDEKEPTPADKEAMSEMERWVLTCGGTDHRPPHTQWSFVDFLAIMVRDLLIYDQVAIETVPSKDGGIAYFIPSASGSMRLASKNLKSIQNSDKTLQATAFQTGQFLSDEDRQKELEIAKRDAKDPNEYRYVQVYNGQIIRGFTDNELILKMMNPVTDLEANGYSVGPLELLANTVSYHLFAEAHNRLFFVQGFASRGILHIEGDIPKKDVEAFRRQWREQLSGAQNSWRTPILAGGTKMNWISLSPSNRDMEWSGWVEYLIKIICAIYTIAPQEINFDITRSQGPTFADSGAKNDSILHDSKVRGLWPILKFFENIINENIIKRYDKSFYDKYEFTFCGFNASNIETELDRIQKECETYKTVNEIRKEHDLEEIEGGDIICNPTYIQWRINETNNEQIAQQQASANLQEEQGVETEGTINSFDSETSDETNQGDIKLADKASKKPIKKAKFLSPDLIKIEYYKK